MVQRIWIILQHNLLYCGIDLSIYIQTIQIPYCVVYCTKSLIWVDYTWVKFTMVSVTLNFSYHSSERLLVFWFSYSTFALNLFILGKNGFISWNYILPLFSTKFLQFPVAHLIVLLNYSSAITIWWCLKEKYHIYWKTWVDIVKFSLYLKITNCN